MRALGKLAFTQTKLYLRDPMSVFFTIAFGPIYLILMGVIFGNNPQDIFGGRGQMDITLTAFIALVIGITGLTAVPIGAALRRETGVLRRLSATPLKPLTYFLADIAAPFVVILLGITLMIALGFILFHVSFVGNWFSLAGGILLSIAAFFAVGYLIAGLVPNSRTAVILGNVLIIPMNIFSGAAVPLEIMPETIRTIAQYNPLTHAVTLLRGLWFGEAWSAHLLELAVLSGLLILCTVVVALTFKWE